MLTIGQVATFAGVTPRTVRHYHARGLLPEPERDHSGYRRYGPQAVVDLIRIRTLTEAGVPLSRVRELMHAGPEAFTAAVAEIENQLRRRVRELERHRQAVTELATSDGLAVPAEVQAYLDDLRALGLNEQAVSFERDSWILLAARMPDRIAGWIATKRAALTDPAYRRLYQRLGECYLWAPDDPRLDDVADEFAALIDAELGEHTDAEVEAEWLDPDVAALIDAQVGAASPTLQRLVELVQARGFVGWTNIRRASSREAVPAGRPRR